LTIVVASSIPTIVVLVVPRWGRGDIRIGDSRWSGGNCMLLAYVGYTTVGGGGGKFMGAYMGGAG
jgi:hypothetical protein